MRTNIQLFILPIVALFLACRQSDGKKNVTDTVQENLEKEIEEQRIADSIRHEKVLEEALKIASQNIEKDIFIEQYKTVADSIPVDVEINSSYHFTKNQVHLIIRRSDSGTTYIDIYARKGNEFEKVLSHEESSMVYINDTIRDIDGDGLSDFVVNGYGASGCCLKAFSEVYLLRPDKLSFSNSFWFINPTFSPKEKVIRGICYGHFGETEMYKYKWNGEKIDTIEYVSHEKNDKGVKTGKIILSKDRPYSKVIKVLDLVPTEYYNIDGYDWFAGSWE